MDGRDTLFLLYGQPTDPAAFDDYYENTHMPIAYGMPGVSRRINFRNLVTTVGGQPDIYMIVAVQFESTQAMHESVASEAARAAEADIPNFATGGVTILVGQVETIIGVPGATRQEPSTAE